MVQFRYGAGGPVHRMGKMTLRGIEMRRGRAFNAVGTTGSLTNQYLQRKMLLAKADDRRRRHERPDDQTAIQPNVSKDPQEGSEEPRLSGARLEEMVKMAGEAATG